MAPEAPDPKTFASWEEAFKYPIPAVRGMEKQLRRDIDSNREKLRTLVGASYRDLLGTAETIIDMDTQMHDVETYLGEIGKKCNTRVIDKKVSNFRNWDANVVSQNSGRYTFASQLAVLRNCPNVISRLLKIGGSVLLAAKILVLSRLLHTKLSQRPSPPPYLEILRDKLGMLRRRLLGKIVRRFKRLDIARDVLVEAMCAFSLATSSSAKDVLRHYHHIRQEAISESMEAERPGRENMLIALRLYVKSLRDTQAVIPNQLAHALEKLKSTSLIKNQGIHGLVELNLDVYERWLGDDIKTFTPYIRHDDISKTEAEKSLSQWAKTTFTVFLIALRNKTQAIQDPLDLMQLRREILELWLSSRHDALGIDPTYTLDGLRDVFNLQASCIVQSRASRLEQLGNTVREVLQNWQPGISDSSPSLWESSMNFTEISHGGKSFRENLTARSLGKNGLLSRVSHEYTTFLEGIKATEDMISKMRKTKWADDMDDMDDEDDNLENKQILLSEDDPGQLQEQVSGSLREAYKDFQDVIGKLHPDATDGNRSQKTCFLLRTWRELRQNLPLSYQNSKLGLYSIAELHNTNAEEVLQSPLQQCSKRLQKLARSGSLPTRPLWEGDPQLPILPSPWAYRLLLDAMAAMTACGSDIWTPQATNSLKIELITKASPLIAKLAFDDHPKNVNGYMNGQSDGELVEAQKEASSSSEIAEKEADALTNRDHTNGHSPHTSTSHSNLVPQPNDLKIQTLFDITYLIHATTIKDQDLAENALISLQSKLVDDLAPEARSVERIKNDAGEYWKRTSLLFGLLA